jgi:hypothetical protein
MVKLYRESAGFRMVLRAIVMTILAWIVQLGADEPIDAAAVRSLIVGIAYALLGLATPLEPFVGIKAKRVEVPAPPAAPEI